MAAIADHYRELIARGELSPRDRLPTRAEIERAFSASPVTVQKAMQRLIDDGFVDAGRRGTFVSGSPPSSGRYVLAFPLPREDPGWVRFWTVLGRAAEAWGAADGVTVSVYTGVSPADEGGGYSRLLDDVRARRLAGVIFGTDPWPLEGTPVLQAEWLPRAAFIGPPGRPGLAGVSLGSHAAFFGRALDLLAEKGRRRIGLITVPGISGERLSSFTRGLADRGMTCRPEWMQTAHQLDPKWAAHLTLLMFRAEPGARPDGLVIADDNLVEHACSGVVQAGLRLPRDLEIVAHSNFPAPAPRALPIHRLGYDIDRAFATCVDLIERKRRGEDVPLITGVQPVLEVEVERVAGASRAATGRRR